MAVITREKSEALFEAAQKIIPGGVNSPVRAFHGVGGSPFFIERAAGPYLRDVDDNLYIDYVLSWGPLVLGHAHEKVVQALQEQITRGTSYGAPTELETELAELIISLMPSIEMIRFVNSGTEAVMSALRLARAFTGKQKIIKFAGCYHGHADMLLVQAGSGVATLGLPDSPGVPLGSTQDTVTVPFNDLAAVDNAFRQAYGKVAAIIVEPVVGNMGFVQPYGGFLSGLRDLADQYHSLLIFDEVMTGFRVAMGGAQELFAVQPDLTVLGKVIGGGLPVGAYGGRKDIMEMIAPSGPVYQAGTLSGNPLAMTAGLATLREWMQPDVFENVSLATQTLVRNMVEIAAECNIPLQAGSLGTMWGFFFNDDPVLNFDDAKRSDTELYARFFHRMLNQGVYFAPSQFEAAFMSTEHTEDIISRTISAFATVLTTLSGPDPEREN
jgi:glutamate-1-semialdehyde 2,1-aminomutase